MQCKHVTFRVRLTSDIVEVKRGKHEGYTVRFNFRFNAALGFEMGRKECNYDDSAASGRNSPRVRGPVLCQCATELREMRNSRVDDVCEQIE
jgi:hypothetical protein